MSRPSVCATVALLSLLVSTAPRPARASDFYGRWQLGPMYLVNDLPRGADSHGWGIGTELALGARLLPALALHASFFADYSSWMAIERALSSGDGYETAVVGLGIGASTSWSGITLGLATGAQATYYPELEQDPRDLSGAGIGPFVSASLGYESDALKLGRLGIQGVARYRVSKDAGDPKGYELGLLLSLALPDERGSERGGTAVTEAGSEPREPLEAPAHTGASPATYTLSAQMGWWNAELELLTASGAYLALGGPWVGALLGPGNDRTIIPFGVRLGYQLDLSSAWQLRAAAHLAGLYGSAGRCVDCASNGTDSWQLFELGARHQSSSGLVYGLDLPLFVINDVLGLDNDSSSDPFFAPPVSLAFLQLYVGYAWGL